jgi:signal transduction histidine kinase
MSYAVKNSNRSNQYWRKLIFDFVLVLLIFFVTYFISSYFNVSDHFFLWASNYEETLDIDELPIGLLASLGTLLWLSERRIYESNILMKQNHALLQRVLEVQETERKRIAQDLHDDLGQYLNAIKAQATSLLLDSASSVDTRMTAQRIAETADYSYQAARKMMHSLRPVALDELGLAAALEYLVESWSSVQGVSDKLTKYQIKIHDNIDQFTEHINIGIFRIVQESLTNIAKHANASFVDISIVCFDNSLKLSIQDDGVGFDMSKPKKGYGLMGIAERAEALGGTLTINSSSEGTVLIVSINTQSTFIS